jgi:hypothetical protein
MITNQEIQEMEKRFPKAYFDIEVRNGQIKVSPKRCQIRVFEADVKIFLESGKASFDEMLKSRLQESTLDSNDFMQLQVLIPKETKQLLSEKAKACGTRKLTYLSRLLK